MRRRTVAVLGVIALALTLFTAAPAQAANVGTVVCKGYAACAAAGHSNHGYKKASSVEYWKMVSGHNCTNYVAYRLIASGMSSTRPWDGNGNATAWGTANADITNHTPTVGSVAWWAAGDNGAGSAGHVAYVEKVISARKILVSEDNYGGDFYYRILTKSSGTWPTGFVHLKDSTTSSSFPAYRARLLDETDSSDDSYLSPGDTATVVLSYRNTGERTWSGLRLKARGGSSALAASDWLSAAYATTQQESAVVTGGEATFVFTVQAPTGVADGTVYSQKFVPVDADGDAVKLGTVELSFTVDSRPAFSRTSALVISGTARQGSVLTATTGSWSPVQPTLSYQWMRDGEPISGATSASYRLKDADVGSTISLTAVASADGYRPTTLTATVAKTIRSIWPSTLARGATLRDGQLVSVNGKYRLVVTESGRVAILNRYTKKVVWATAKVGAVKVKLRSDGILVAYDKHNHPVWKTAGARSGANRAIVTSSGKLVLRSATDRVKWDSSKH
ncbi:MAG: CHAP domain-containing protein [Microbacteriaceae bacterium]